MMSSTGTRGLLLAAALLAGGWGWFRSTDPDVERGNQHYQSGEFREALEAYRKSVGRGDEDGIHHNMGATLYKLAESDDPVLKSSSYHNLGNVQFQRGEYEEAVQSYKRALRANPNNDDARYNLELTLRKLN